MLAEFTAGLFPALFTTAPPHLSAIYGLMLPTAPFEVLLLLVLLIAVLACLVPTIKLALPLDELLDSGLLLFFFGVELSRQSLQVVNFLLIVSLFLGQLGDFLYVGSIALLASLPICIGLLLSLLLCLKCVL